MKFCRNFTLLFVILTIAGCSTLEKLPQGTQLQSSTFGLRFSPQSIDGAPLVLGSHSFIATTAQPADAGANLNRFQAEAPMGVNIRSTVATGDVGEQLEAAGGPAALEQLLGNEHSGNPLPPLPLPRTDLEAPEPRERE